jgi:sugar/nucleoside kinase (ribokinase family)
LPDHGGTPPRLVAVGDVLADIVIEAGPEVSEKLGLVPGAAVFGSRAEVDEAVAELDGGPFAVSAGGSVANTCVAFAASGGRADLLTALMADEFADAVGTDLRRHGVTMPLERLHGGATGRCLVLVAHGGERTLLFWQGEPWRLRVLRTGVVSWLAGGIPYDGVLVEGYLLATAAGTRVARSALAGATASGRTRILTLSDTGLITANRPRFQALLADGIDVVMGTEDEAIAVTGAADVRQAVETLSRLGVLAVVTMGERGALAHGPSGHHVIDATDVPVVSSAGAGDAFAGGFLFGLLSGASPSVSLELGRIRANAVLQVQEARAP